MKRIVRVINRFNLGGPTYNAAYLTKYLYPEYETILVGGPAEKDEESSEYILEALGIKPIIIEKMHREINAIDDYSSYLQLKKIIKDYKPDIVHTHASKAGMLGRKAAFNLNVPTIVHTFHGHIFHSYFGPLKTQLYVFLEQHLAKSSSGIIALSELQKKELSNQFKIADDSKFKIIPLGFDLEKFKINYDDKRDFFRKALNIAENDVVVGIVGRLVPIKNHQLFIKAIQNAKKNCNKNIRAIVIGDGQTRKEIEELSLSLNLTISPTEKADITFLSWVKDVENVYPGLDIVCLTSLNEGTPVSLIEAQAAGKPIVSTRVGGISDVVKENETALLSNIGDENKYFENLCEIINNDELRHKMSNKGWEYVFEKFHYTRLINDMKIYYEQLSKLNS